MAILTGFPPSNTISPSVRIAEKDLSFVSPEQSFHRAGVVGFASKGPINIPTLITSTTMLHRIFGYAHPDVSDPFLIYAAEQYLTVSSELYVVRVGDQDAVSDEAAVTAQVSIPAAGGKVIMVSDLAGPLRFDRTGYFRYKVNGVLMSKTLVLENPNPPTRGACYDGTPAYDTGWSTDGGVTDGLHTSEVVDLLNAQMTDGDTGLFNELYGIKFALSDALDNDSPIQVESTYAYGPDATIELVSVKDQLYGGAEGKITHLFGHATPSPFVDQQFLDCSDAVYDNPLGLGTAMTAASLTGDAEGFISAGPVTPDSWSFDSTTFPDGLFLHVVVDGTDSTSIDNVVQILDLSALVSDSVSYTSQEVLDAINEAIAAGAGGFEGSLTGNQITLTTVHKGVDARILVKSLGGYGAFGFTGLTASGTTPSGSTDDVDTSTPGLVYGSAIATTPTFLVTADSSGIEGNETIVRFTNNVYEGNFNLEVYNRGVQVEAWGSLVKDVTSSFYVGTFLDLVSDYVRVQDDTTVGAPPLNGDYTLSGGTDGLPADPDDQDSLLVGSDIATTGMFALSDSEQVDIDIIAVPGHPSTRVVMAMLDLCQRVRQDCLAIIDPPFGLTVNEIVNWQNGSHPLNSTRFDSDFGALYWPWVKIYDTFNGVDVWIPPSGSVMAVYARSDFLSAPWFAPAGLNRGSVPNITDVFNRPSLPERDQMYGYRNCVNPIVQFQDVGGGFVVWGQKTLQRKPTALDRVNVRRMMFALEKRIKRDCRNLLFEPNDLIFKITFINTCEKVLKEIQRGRGLHDYFIDVSDEINTSDVIDRNEFRARIGVQPTRAVEFIFIEFSIHRTGSFVQNADNIF